MAEDGVFGLVAVARDSRGFIVCSAAIKKRAEGVLVAEMEAIRMGFV